MIVKLKANIQGQSQDCLYQPNNTGKHIFQCGRKNLQGVSRL
jgi:hypothetical protein